MKKQSKKDLVLQHLQRQPITSMDAIELYRNTRLADSVFVLRKEGHNITTKTIKTENGSYAEYRLEKQDDSSSSGQLELSDSVDVRGNWRARGAYDES